LSGAAASASYSGMKNVEHSHLVAASDAASSMPARECPYQKGDPVEIFSKSNDAWVPGSVVKVQQWLLTVQYGDRERKIDLNAPGISSFFRAPTRPLTTLAPLFESMITEQGGQKDRW